VQPKVRIETPKFGEVVPVDDDIAPQDVELGRFSGDGGGSGDGDKGFGPEVDGLESDVLIVTPQAARADDFVAIEREPELLFMREPHYPEFARDAGIEGTVMIRALVGADGFVLQSLVLQSVTGLDEAALEAVATGSFRPALQQGLPVAAWVVVPIQFSLRR
jgi:protein TonB